MEIVWIDQFDVMNSSKRKQLLLESVEMCALWTSDDG